MRQQFALRQPPSWLKNSLQKKFRLFKIYWTTLLVLADFIKFRLFALFLSKSWAERNLPLYIVSNARRVKNALLDAKGLFIKVGQLISTLSSHLPEAFRNELESLQDQIPPCPPEKIIARIESELGAHPNKLFHSFNPEPIASASLAQVHEAVLKDGQKIALKIQHIDIEKTAKADLLTFKRILRLVNFFVGLHGLETYHSQIEVMVKEELDFEKEAANLERITANFQESKLAKFPILYSAYSSEHIVAIEFINGTKITDTTSLLSMGIDTEELAKRLLTVYCEMFIVHGFYHADPHPGNILVQDDGSIVFIDFGAVAELSPGMKAGIPHLIQGGLHQDSNKIIQTLRQMGFITAESEDDLLVTLVDYYQQRFHNRNQLETWTLSHIAVDMSEDWNSIFDFTKFGISIPELISSFQVPIDWVLMHRTLILLAGVATELAPELKPVPLLAPYLKNIATDKSYQWDEVIKKSAKEVTSAVISTPLELHQFLKAANKGKLKIHVAGINESVNLFYNLGQQLIFSLLAIASGAALYFSHTRKDSDIEQLAAVGLIASLYFVFRAILNGKRWQKRLKHLR